MGPTTSAVTAGSGVLADRDDLVVRAVERRADQVVHRGVHDDEFLLAVPLAVEHAREQHARGPTIDAARLDHHASGRWRGAGRSTLSMKSRMGGRLFAGLVGDAESAAEIEVTDGMPASRSRAASASTLSTASRIGRGVQDLRADVAAHAVGREAAEAAGAVVDRAPLRRWRCRTCAGSGRSRCTGGWTASTSGLTRIEKPAFTPRRAAMASISASSASDSQLKLWMPFAARTRPPSRGLADAGEHDLRRIAAGLQHAKQLAAGDDVEAGAGFRQQRQHGQRRVGLDGVADGWGRSPKASS